jgi:hypothetical protein
MKVNLPGSASRVDELIESGASLSEIGRHFPCRGDALNYYAGAMSRKFAREQVGSKCELCGSSRSDVMKCTWHGTEYSERLTPLLVIGIILGGGHFFVHGRTWKFVTYHGICTTCRRQFYVRRTIAVVMQCFGLALIGIGGLLLTCWCVPALFEVVEIHETASMRWWGGVGAASCVVGVTFLWLRRLLLPLPPPLETVRRKPFELAIALPSNV